MKRDVDSFAADLSAYPNLAVVYLGMRVYNLRGLYTVVRLRREVLRSVAAKPDGLLLHESFYFSLVPLHIGLRQYWRDFASLETWTRTLPHQAWWKDFARNAKGTGFWHETYLRRGGMEGIYDAMREPTGLLRIVPAVRAEGRMYTARERIKHPESLPEPPNRRVW
jgi:hypothetical protein